MINPFTSHELEGLIYFKGDWPLDAPSNVEAGTPTIWDVRDQEVRAALETHAQADDGQPEPTPPIPPSIELGEN